MMSYDMTWSFWEHWVACSQQRQRHAQGPEEERPYGTHTGALALGGLIGCSPWLFGLVVLDLPYFEATIHASANPSEAMEVHSRSAWGQV